MFMRDTSAKLLGFATEELSLRVGQTIGGKFAAVAAERDRHS
jgi:hypothetical protein